MTIHGFNTVTTDFGRLYFYLDFYDEVKAVEVPGHNGKVDMRKFTLKSTVEAVLSAYDDLRARHDEVDVVGFSMGGALASWLCTVRDVHRVVLLAPANKYINFAMPFSAMKFYGDLHRDTYKNTDGKHGEKMSAVKEAFAPYVDNVKTSVKIVTDRAKYASPHALAVFTKLMSMCNDAIEKSKTVDTPTFIMWGKLDELVPYKSVTFLLDHFPNAQHKVYEDVGHAMLYTNKDDVLIADAVDFLSNGEVQVKVPQRG